MRRYVVGCRASIAIAFGLLFALVHAGAFAASVTHYADMWRSPAGSGVGIPVVRQAQMPIAAIGGYSARSAVESPVGQGVSPAFNREDMGPQRKRGAVLQAGDQYAPVERAVHLLSAVILLVLSMVGIAYTPGAGITGTPHDWPCRTCHTPDVPGPGSLQWNVVRAPTPYRWNNFSTTAGTPYPMFAGNVYKGSSIVCLSCHDGVVTGCTVISQRGDLSRNHPVAMPYPVNGVPSTYNFIRNGAVREKEWVANPMAVSGIRLYRDDGSGNMSVGVAVGHSGVECSSCHDVHNGPSVKDQKLLRGQLSAGAGYICAQCHVK